MIRSFSAVDGQSIFDVCLNCYGTLDLLYKLIQDSSVGSVNDIPQSRQVYIYDDSLVSDQNINQSFTLNGLKYATITGQKGSIYYIISQLNPPKIVPPVGPTNPDPTMSTYQLVGSTSFTSSADGTTVITLVDADGNSMIGYDIVQIEREIKPFTADQFQWNKTNSMLTLLGGTTVDKDQTLFVIYSKMVTV